MNSRKFQVCMNEWIFDGISLLIKFSTVHTVMKAKDYNEIIILEQRTVELNVGQTVLQIDCCNRGR